MEFKPCNNYYRICVLCERPELQAYVDFGKSCEHVNAGKVDGFEIVTGMMPNKSSVRICFRIFDTGELISATFEYMPLGSKGLEGFDYFDLNPEEFIKVKLSMRRYDKTAKWDGEGVAVDYAAADAKMTYNVFKYVTLPTEGSPEWQKSWLAKAKAKAGIEGIFVNEEKGIVVTLFKDGYKHIARCSHEDPFDPKVGVALAIASHLLGSKTQFAKLVEKAAKKQEGKKKGKEIEVDQEDLAEEAKPE